MTTDPAALAAWKAQATKELRGAELLNHVSKSGLRLKALYTALDTADIPESLPGQPPYTRGIRASMYAGRPWTVRQYAGFSGPAESNAFYRASLAAGQQGLSVAFDLPTQRGYDSDHSAAVADVGKAGVAIDSVADMHALFEGIPLASTSVSMTMSGAVLPVLAAYIVAAQEQGAGLHELSGTIQNDILKEFMVRNTYIYPPEPSLRVVGDIIEFAAQHLPRFNPISISGYHLHEAGAGAALELAYTLANGLEYVRAALGRGLDIDQFAPRLSFFFGVGMDFYPEIAKLRAARTLWAELMAQFAPQNPASLMLRTHTQTSGWSLTQQDPLNNIVRTTIEALAAVFGGTQSLHTNAYDEALALPSDHAARIARNTQHIIAHETGIPQVIDPWGGSYLMERLTTDLIQEVRQHLAEIAALGGMSAAISTGLPKRRIEQAALLRQARIDRGEEVVVGVNKFVTEGMADEPDLRAIDTQALRQAQTERLHALKASRDPQAVSHALNALQQCAHTGTGNLLALSIEAMRVRATVGEVSAALEAAWGRHSAEIKPIRGAYAQGQAGNAEFVALQHEIEVWAKRHHRPYILLTKLGQDGHDRGLQLLASGLSDLGFAVTVLPLFQTPQQAATQALTRGVDVVGVSSLAAGHGLIPPLITALRQGGGGQIPVIVGGIIPAPDQEILYKAGVRALFGPGSSVVQVGQWVLEMLRAQLPSEQTHTNSQTHANTQSLNTKIR